MGGACEIGGAFLAPRLRRSAGDRSPPESEEPVGEKRKTANQTFVTNPQSLGDGNVMLRVLGEKKNCEPGFCSKFSLAVVAPG